MEKSDNILIGNERVASPERHVVLVAPEVHWNTGNVGRTCLGANASLHLVRIRSDRGRSRSSWAELLRTHFNHGLSLSLRRSTSWLLPLETMVCCNRSLFDELLRVGSSLSLESVACVPQGRLVCALSLP